MDARMSFFELQGKQISVFLLNILFEKVLIIKHL